MCDQQSLKSTCAYAQFDQSLCLSLEYLITVKLLTEHHLEFLSLKGDCTGSSESTLVQMPHCWKSHVAAQISFYRCRQAITNDGKTQDIADRVFHKIKNCTGFYPMMLVMNLHRSKLDLNRKLAPATFGEEIPKRIYHEYHSNVSKAADEMINSTNPIRRALGFDFHGFKDDEGDDFGERSALGTYENSSLEK